MKRITALLLCLMMLLALCACEKDEPAPTPTPKPTPTYDAVSFENHGKTVTVSKLPKKVVTAGPNCTEVFCALGLADTVIGKCMSNHSLGALEELSEDFYTVPDLTVGYPTLVDIVNSGCDFLYATDWIFGEDLTVKALEKAGITVFVSSGRDIGSLYEDIRTIAKIFEVSDVAEELIAADSARISELSDKLPQDTEPMRVLVLDSFINDSVYVTGSYAFENALIEAAGGVNVFAELEKPYDAVSMLDIIAAHPDFIIIHDYQDSEFEGKLETLQNDPMLSRLACVQNGKIMQLSLENSLPGVRTAITVEAIATALYPDCF